MLKATSQHHHHQTMMTIVGYLGHGLASRAGVALDLLELQLASDLDFRAKGATARDQAITHRRGTETESGLGLSSVLEWAAWVTAQQTVLIAIQLG